MAMDRWSEDTYTVKEVVYDLSLPQTVMVVEGFYTEDEQLSMANGDILDFLSVTEKQFITAVTKGTENGITKNMLFPSDSSILIHVTKDGTSPEIVKSIKSVKGNNQNYIKLDCDVKARNASNEEVFLTRGVYLETLMVAKSRGLACKYRGGEIYLPLNTKGQFLLVSKNSIFELSQAVKRFSFPFQGYFVEDSENDIDYCCVDFLREETKKFLSYFPVLPTERSIRCSVISTELLLPLDRYEVIQTEVRVKEQHMRNRKIPSFDRVPDGSQCVASQVYDCDKKSASRDNAKPQKLDPSTVEETMYSRQNLFPSRNSGENRLYELASSVNQEKRMKRKPPPPPPRTVSISQEERQSQVDSLCQMQFQDNIAREDEQPPKLPPRNPPKATGSSRKCDITLKSGTSGVPISLKILAQPTQKGNLLYENTDMNSDAGDVEEDDDDADDDKSMYIKMKKSKKAK